MSQLQYIRRTYNVPAYRGRRVRYTWPNPPKEGRIVCASAARLRVKFDGEKRCVTLHPTWELEYLPENAQTEEPAQLDDEDEEIDDATRYALGAM